MTDIFQWQAASPHNNKYTVQYIEKNKIKTVKATYKVTTNDQVCNNHTVTL